MTPIRRGDGTGLDPEGFTEVRKGDGTVLWSAIDIPDSGVSRWTFDSVDLDGSDPIDVWGDNDATNNGATTGVDGTSETYDTGEAFEFDGTDDYVSAAVPDEIQGTGDKSAALWFRYDSQGYMLAIGTNDISQGFGAFVHTDDKLNFWGSNDDFTTGEELTTGQWYHVAITYDGDDVAVYLDGDNAADGVRSKNLDTGDDETTIGARMGGRVSIEGRIDDVRIYDKALSSSEISNLYTSGRID